MKLKPSSKRSFSTCTNAQSIVTFLMNDGAEFAGCQIGVEFPVLFQARKDDRHTNKISSRP